jgi:hypothetical protein
MAVVINDMEVAPQPATQAAGSGQQGSADAGAKDPTKLVEKKLRVKRARNHRLEAY